MLEDERQVGRGARAVGRLRLMLRRISDHSRRRRALGRWRRSVRSRSGCDGRSSPRLMRESEGEREAVSHPRGRGRRGRPRHVVVVVDVDVEGWEEELWKRGEEG